MSNNPVDYMINGKKAEIGINQNQKSWIILHQITIFYIFFYQNSLQIIIF